MSLLRTFALARVVVALFALAPFALAQSSVAPVSRAVEGRVMRAAERGGPEPVVGQWVVLHRVGSDHSAPLDSVRTDRTGTYRITYKPSGDPEALYFVSARYAGIAYFAVPLHAPVVRGGDADVIVYATTTDTTGLRLQGRHLVVSAPRSVRREVAEVFEIENSGFRTVVARDSNAPVWSTRLPAQAESVAIAPGDVSMSAVAIRPDRAELYAPISPGVRQLVLTYQLPPNAFPLSLDVGREVSVLEVLLEEPRAIVEGAMLTEVAPAAIDRRMFRRFLAQDVPAKAVMRVSAPPPVEQNSSAMRAVATVVAVSMVVALGFWFAARRSRREPKAESRAPMAGILVAELATLDARFDQGQPSAEQRAAHEQRRAQLKDQIARALAAENPPA